MYAGICNAMHFKSKKYIILLYYNIIYPKFAAGTESVHSSKMIDVTNINASLKRGKVEL